MTVALLEVADSILYVSALLADRPRPIDRVIDYFGGVPQTSALELRPRRQTLAS